jgi:D-glycero-D-manno-heptose 1,7-bisphosphate phosphatase
VKAIFFDRDGVVNLRKIDDYVRSWEEFTFLPGIADILAEVHDAGRIAVLVTNQRGIGRGLMSEEDLADIHRRMQEELASHAGTGFDAIYHCPHERSDNCSCRKPLPGMLMQAAAEHNISLADSWMIGDSESDIEAGIAAGCHTARIAAPDEPTQAEIAGESLRDVWEKVRATL